MTVRDQNAAASAAVPTTKALDAPTSAPQGKRRRWGRMIAGTLLALFLALALYVAIFLLWPAWKGYQAAQDLRTIAASGLTQEQAPAIEDALLRADAAYGAIVSGMRPFNPILRRLNFVPQWGGTIAAAPELMAIGREASAMAAEVAPTLGAALATNGMLQRVSALSAAIAEDPARVERLAEHAGRIGDLAAALPVEQLDPRIQNALQVAQPLLPLLPEMMRAMPGLPVLLGEEEPHTYLLLVQNNHELRPTGGFITAIGRLTLDRGEIVELDFSDSYAIFRIDTAHPPPPAPMREYMGIPYLVFRDANWSPDLPTSSAVAHTLYTLDSDLDYDDTITVDLFAVEGIVNALAPLTLEGVETPVSGDNIMEIVKELWARPPDSEGDLAESVTEWWRDRKNFIPLMAKAGLEKVMGGDADYGELAAALLTALDRREIQIVTDAPGAKEMLAGQGWDGSLQPPDRGDFLALVETNFGYNKANAAVERTMDYRVDPPAEAGDRALATLTITYTHTFDGEDPGCDQTPRYGVTYDDMVARCYFSYLRLYVPVGSELQTMTGVFENSIISQRGEKNTQQFAGYFILPPNESNIVTISWLLPEDLSQQLANDDYSLRIQRQSGSGALPLTIQAGEHILATTLESGKLDWTPAAPASPAQ